MTLAELREAVELAQKSLDNELFRSDQPMTAAPFAGLLANVADQRAQLIAAQQRRIEKLEAGLKRIVEISPPYILAYKIAYDLLHGENGGAG